jgi:hypothetical protein
MTEEVRQGWYRDPVGRHQYRWFSQGVPTDLVKDGITTSRDSISSTDPANYQSMQLAQEPDVGPLLHTDAPPPKLELLNFGDGLVAVINTATSASQPAVFSERAGILEVLGALLPLLAACFLLAFFRIIDVLPFVALSVMVATLGLWRRRRRARRFLRHASNAQG